MPQEIEIPFPVKGVSKGFAYNEQPPLTSPDEQNVRSYDPVEDRIRGGQRHGHSKQWPFQINGSNAIQDINHCVVQIDDTATPPGTVSGFNDLSVDMGDITYRHGQFYMAGGAGGAGLLSIVNRSGTTTDSVAKAYGGANSARLAVDADGNVYTGDPNVVIEKFNTSLASQWTIAGIAPVGILWDDANARGYASRDTAAFRAFDTDGNTLWTSTVTSSSMNQMAVSGTSLYVGSDILNTSTGVSTANNANIQSVRCVALLPDGSLVMGGTNSTTQTGANAQLWKVSSDLQTISASLNINTAQQIYKLQVTPWGTVIAVGDDATGPNAFELSQDDLSIIDSTDVGATTQLNAVTLGNDSRVHVVGADNASNTGWQWTTLNFTASSHRQVTSTFVAGGLVQTSTNNDPPATATNGSGALDTTGFVRSVCAFGKVYFVDGTNYKVLDIATNTVSTWTATNGGTLPSSTGTARLITLYSGSVVLSGVVGDDQNIWFSKIFDPLDYDPAPATPTATDAVILNSGTAGVIGDTVTGLIPHYDDLLVVGGDQSIHVVRGYPTELAGGRVDEIPGNMGMAFGTAWTHDHLGNLYFFGSDHTVYRLLIRGDQIAGPTAISDITIDRELKAIDLAGNRVRMAWDRRAQGLHVYITPLAEFTTKHYYYCARTEAWHPDVVPAAFGPTAVHTFDGDRPDDRVVWLGGHDGYIRRIDHDADDDDGTAIASHVVYPPLRLTGQSKEFGIRRLMATLGEDSDSLNYQVRVGTSAQAAIDATASYSGSWTSGGRNADVRKRARGNTLALRIDNSTLNNTWATEEIAVEGDVLGPVRP